MSIIGRPHYALVAGLFASVASVFGKLITYSDRFFDNIAATESQQLTSQWILKLTCIALMVLCNVLVWTFFVKSLHEKGGSIVATLTSTSTNYCCSAAIGCLVFDEKTTALWWLGATLVIIGLVLVSVGNNQHSNESETLSSKTSISKDLKKE